MMALVWSCGRCGAGIAGDDLPLSWEEQRAEDEWIDSHGAQHEREDERAETAAAAARLAETPGPALQDAAAVELADAARRLQSLAGVDDQGRDACRHRAPCETSATQNYRRADLPAPADPAHPYGPRSAAVAPAPLALAELLALLERVGALSTSAVEAVRLLDRSAPHLRGRASGIRFSSVVGPALVAAADLVARAATNDELAGVLEDLERAVPRFGVDEADRNSGGQDERNNGAVRKVSLPGINTVSKCTNDLHEEVVVLLPGGLGEVELLAPVSELGGHESSLSVGQVSGGTGPDGGAPGFLRPGASDPTVGVPADIRMGSSVPCVEVGGGSVEGAVHGAPSTEFDLERFEVAWPDDSAGNPDLVCTWCDDVLCEVEQGDTVLVLVSVCESHVCGPAPVVLP